MTTTYASLQAMPNKTHFQGDTFIGLFYTPVVNPYDDITWVHRVFTDCTFQGCVFNSMNLSRTTFNSCTFIDCDLYYADLKRTDLRFTKLKGKTRLPLEGLDSYNLPKKSTFILAQPVIIIIHNRECIQIEDEVRTYEDWLSLPESYWLSQLGNSMTMEYVHRTLNFYLQGK